MVGSVLVTALWGSCLARRETRHREGSSLSIMGDLNDLFCLFLIGLLQNALYTASAQSMLVAVTEFIYCQTQPVLLLAVVTRNPFSLINTPSFSYLNI